jgi:hypothetical protein
MTQKQNNKTSFGSDHFIHLSILKKIKSNGFKYGVKKISGYNEENSTYPILFHYILACFFYKTAINNPNRIGFVITIISIFFFNFFLSHLIGLADWFFILKANILYLIFPFSYIYWNAKNMGLTARGFGLLIGQIFTYCLVFYLKGEGSITWIIMMTVFSFTALLGSQFAFQYILFVSLVTSLFVSQLQLLIPVVISLVLFRLLLPKFSKEFFRGQYNHKRNYALYLAPIYILKTRPSIYRDFIYDFWIKLRQLKKEKVETLYYIYSNPVFELIYGFPFLWVFIYYLLKNGAINNLETIDSIIASSLALFFLISLRPFRFLGEPQRYVEFVIPLISISFLYYVPYNIQLVIALLSIAFIALTKFVFYSFKEYSNHDHDEITHFLKNKFSRETIISSNDSNFSKFLIPYFNIVKTDLTRHYKDIVEFNFYHNNNFAIHSVNGLLEFHKIHKTDLIIINLKLHSQADIDKLHSKLDIKEVRAINNYIIYKT